LLPDYKRTIWSKSFRTSPTPGAFKFVPQPGEYSFYAKDGTAESHPWQPNFSLFPARSWKFFKAQPI